MVIIAHDPGENAGTALLIDGVLVSMHLFPHMNTARGFAAWAAWFDAQPTPDLVVLEDPVCPSHNSVRGQRSLGERVGEVRGFVRARGAKLLEPTPATWQKDLYKGSVGNDKALQVVQRYAPGVEVPYFGARGGRKTDGAVAACLAIWAHRRGVS